MGTTFLIIGEHDAGHLKSYSLELAAKGAALAAAAGGTAVGVLVGGAAATTAATWGAYGVKRVIVLDGPALSGHYNSDAVATALVEVIQSLSPQVVLASATPFGRDCLPRVGMRCKTGVVPDAVALDWRDGRLVARHPIYAGKAWADIAVRGTPAMALARPNAFGLPAAGSGQAEVEVRQSAAALGRAVVTEMSAQEQGEVDLTEATTIVAGGRALGSADNFNIIRGLAKVLGASVGASRAAVDAGYIGHSYQVGQTGKTVNPTLYIACGISGAIQHLAGMRTARFVVAINKDPDAPIFSKADFGIVGDLFQILPVLTEKLRAAKAAA